LTNRDKTVGDEQIAATGYDIEHALESCRRDPGQKKHWTYNPFPALAHHATGTEPVQIENLKAPAKPAQPSRAGSQESESQNAPLALASKPDSQSPSQSKIGTEESWMFDPVTTPYSKWSANSLAIFQELSTAVVAGMHIVNEPALAAQLTELKCDTDVTTGILKFPNPDKGQLQCTITGKNLDKVKSVRLRNLKDPTDAATVDGEVRVTGGDNTSATVIYQTAALHKLTSPDYMAMLVDKNGLETKANAAVHLSLARDVETVSPDTIDASNPPVQIVLSGFHLAPDNVKGLTIKTSAGKLELSKAGAPVSTDNVLNFDTHAVTSDKWASLGGENAQATLTLNLNDGSSEGLRSISYKAPAKKLVAPAIRKPGAPVVKKPAVPTVVKPAPTGAANGAPSKPNAN
jgi:hypothetical protein